MKAGASLRISASRRIFMKIVVIHSPRPLRRILAKIFGVSLKKKEKGK